MLFSELYTIMANNVNSYVLGGAIASTAPRGFAPILTPLRTPVDLTTTSSKLFA